MKLYSLTTAILHLENKYFLNRYLQSHQVKLKLEVVGLATVKHFIITVDTIPCRSSGKPEKLMAKIERDKKYYYLDTIFHLVLKQNSQKKM